MYGAARRNGNTLMAEKNYEDFETWIMPILKEMLVEQNTQVCRLSSVFKHDAVRSSTNKNAHLSLTFSGSAMDSFQSDPPPGQGNQQPRIHLLLGLQSECCSFEVICFAI